VGCDICAVVQLIRTNHHGLQKQLGSNRVSVRSYADGFEIYYDFSNVSRNSNGTYEIPFTVSCTTSIRARTDILHWIPQESGAGVLLSFDDWYPCWVEGHLILDNAGALATWFFDTRGGNRDDNQRHNDAVFLWEQGHEIGWHTATHLDLRTLDPNSAQNLAVFYWETVGSMYRLVRDSNIEIFNFAYPFGGNRPWMHERLEQRFHVHRGSTGSGGNWFVYTHERLSEGGFIRSSGVDINGFSDSQDFRVRIRRMFLITKFMGGVVPIHAHEINYTRPATSWVIRPSDLEYLVTAGNKLRLNFFRYKDFMK